MQWRVAATACCVVAVIAVSAQHRSGRTAPQYSSVPDTNFSCLDHMAGYYADMETGCQAYHMCDTLGKQYSYLCPNNTVFNQRFMVCDHWHHVNCTNSGKYYELNMRMAGGGQKVRQSQRSFNLIDIDDKDAIKDKNKNDFKTKIKEKKVQLLIHQSTTPTTARTPVTLRKVSASKPAFPKPSTRPSFLRPFSTSDLSSTASLKFNFATTTKRPFSGSSAFSFSSIKFRPLTIGRIPSTTETSQPESTLSAESVTTKENVSETIMPFMFARNSGTRNGFSFTNLVNPPVGHTDVPKKGIFSPFIGEFLRQFLTPRRTIDFADKDKEKSQQSLQTVSPLIFPHNPDVSFIKISDGVSFPVEPVLLTSISTPKPIVMRGPRQEGITELDARTNSLVRIPQRGSDRTSFHQGNKDFFIPETELIPPDPFKITNSVSRNENSKEEKHMTMLFPKTSRQHLVSGLLLNPACPECHPSFLTPGKCVPCVRIR